LGDLLRRIAERKKATPAQIALAWLLVQKPWIVPIPGTTKLARLDENIGAVAVELTSADLREIGDAAAKIAIQGRGTPKPWREEPVSQRPSWRTHLRRAPCESAFSVQD